jgi:uncharacterized protein
VPPNLRRCISCRCLAPKHQFWRVVRLAETGNVQLSQPHPQANIQPAYQSETRLMGRSAYLCPQRDCLETAQKKNRLAKALKTQVPPEIYIQLGQRLTDI